MQIWLIEKDSTNKNKGEMGEIPMQTPKYPNKPKQKSIKKQRTDAGGFLAESKCAPSNICILMQAYCVYVCMCTVCVSVCVCELLTPFAISTVVAAVVVHPCGTRADSSNIYIQK